ncbi:MAG: acetolactate decarboxylase [Candidatus Brocadiaceae bacterium]|nr:acetolactate decarboxylase [Candidatus Brocadiaceae bacterium]
MQQSIRTRSRLVLVLGLCAALCGCAVGRDRDTLYQVSTLNALLAGLYEGPTTIEELTAHGDLGIGTFDGADGEMAVIDGHVYQMKSDGVAYKADGAWHTPFAAVTFFEPDGSAPVPSGTDMASIGAFLDGLAGAPNVPLAVRVRGHFIRAKTRAVPRQTPPYRRLVEVTKEQPVFDLREVDGDLVGFRLPEYLDGVNMSGYHLHFITADRKAGGHVLDFEVEHGTVEWDLTPRLTLVLPETGAFPDADLTPAAPDEVTRVER